MKNWTFSKRLGIGFGIVILIVVILGSLSAIIMSNSSSNATVLSRDYTKALSLSSEYIKGALELRIAIRNHIIYGTPQTLKAFNDHLASSKEATKNVNDFLKDVSGLETLKKDFPAAEESLTAYQSCVQDYTNRLADLQKIRENMDLIGPKLAENCTNLVNSQSQIQQEELKAKASIEQIQSRSQKFLLAANVRSDAASIRMTNFKVRAERDLKSIEVAEGYFKKIESYLAELEPSLKRAEDIQSVSEIRKYLDEYHKGFSSMSSTMTVMEGIDTKFKELGPKMDKASQKVFDDIIEGTTATTLVTAKQLNFGRTFMIVGVLVAFVIATALAYFIMHSTTAVLTRIIDQLSNGANQTASAANQLTSGSQALASGASEQASSLEETSASMEEMTGMTKRNAENANNAKELVQQARVAAEKAAQDIGTMSEGMQAVAHSSTELSNAMEQIQASSSAITQIMKTIDEIAFQTNILSLNAAVEAARAGEAGAGFAVVADEVRALASRSAEAAKETAKMIKESSDSSRRGVTVTEKVSADLANMNKMAGQVNNSLQVIVSEVHKVDHVIAEIATACQEQSQGISQVNTAITQMDKITQSNAASAEESASAAEQVSAQVQESNSIVSDLASLVGGASSHSLGQADTAQRTQKSQAATAVHSGNGLKKSARSSVASR